jgi:hypothetical protein
VKQDSNMRPSDGANVISGAWRGIRLSAQNTFARVKTVPCYECLRAIRWWNRRIWLVGNKRWVHLHCWKGQLFLKALVAEHIRYVQALAEDNSTLSRDHSPENELQELPTCTAQREQVEQPAILLQPVDELAAETGVDETQRDGKSFLRVLGAALWHVLHRLAPHQSPPYPPHLCMLCGAVEYSKKSVFCSKCGTPLRPSS